MTMRPAPAEQRSAEFRRHFLPTEGYAEERGAQHSRGEHRPSAGDAVSSRPASFLKGRADDLRS